VLHDCTLHFEEWMRARQERYTEPVSNQKNSYYSLFRKQQGKRPLKGPRPRCEDDMKMELKKVDVSMGWFLFAQQWLFNMMNIRIRWKVDFLTNWSTIRFSRWALLNEDKVGKELPMFYRTRSCAVAYPGFFFRGGFNKFSWGQRRERGSGGGSPLVRGSVGSCNLVQEISFHIVDFS